MVTLTVREHPPEVFQAMIEFLYLGETRVNSNDLIDLLHLCQEYLLPTMKQAIEHVFADQLTVPLFHDIYMVMKAFDCAQLKACVLDFGINNRAELRQRGILKDLDREDQLAIVKPAGVAK